MFDASSDLDFPACFTTLLCYEAKGGRKASIMRETLEEQLARNQVEAKRLWAEMETATSDKHRYGLAWGAMDCELACTLIAEELANMIQEKAT